MKIKLRDFFYVEGYVPYAILEEDARDLEGERRIWILSGGPGSLVFHEHIIISGPEGIEVRSVENYFTTFLDSGCELTLPFKERGCQGISIDGKRIIIRVNKEDYERILEEYSGDLSRLLERADEMREIEGKEKVIVELTYYLD